MRDPAIPGFRVVLDEDHTATVVDGAGEAREDGHLVGRRHEVEAVGHQDPVERRQFERRAEVGDDEADGSGREARLHPPLLLREGAPVAIDAHDRTIRSDELRQRERERSFAGSQVSPPLTGRNGRPNERDVILVVHRPAER